MNDKQKFQVERKDFNRLIELLQESHYKAAINNDNISKSVALLSYSGSLNPIHSVAAGLLSTGEVHGPITECRENLFYLINDHESFTSRTSYLVKVGGKIPGLGNSFFKDKIDPSFQEIMDFLRQIHMENDLGLTDIDTYTTVCNKIIEDAKPDSPNNPLFPNAALITAGVVEFLGGKPLIENWFFIAGRSRAWIELMSDM